jgi:hypothetical protein
MAGKELVVAKQRACGGLFTQGACLKCSNQLARRGSLFAPTTWNRLTGVMCTLPLEPMTQIGVASFQGHEPILLIKPDLLPSRDYRI